MRTVALVLLVASTSTLSSLCAAQSHPPNVVFIMVDDLGWMDVGFNGSTVYETPNVDRLAEQGMVLSDFYSGGPVCSPTRASIMTGKYTARTGITTYLLSPTRDAKHVQPRLPLEEFTIAEAFQKNGFATGYFGKWHLGYENAFWAGHQGFDVAKGGIDLPWAWTLCYPEIEEAPTAKTWPKTHTRFFSPYHLTHLDNGPEDEYLTERLTDETIEFIEAHRDEPFFAFLSFHTVHTPLQAKPEKIEKYRKKIAALGLDTKKEKNRREKAFQNNAAYAAMVEHMDENVGRLLTRLDELKLSDSTIVVWTSDNGGKGSVTSNLPLRGMKHNLYEGGIRVPTIVRWPKRIAAGVKNATPLISNDFYPTLLELTGCPAEPKQHVDGLSFASVLLGKRETIDRDAIYWHYPHSRQEAAIRAGQYKLLHRFEQDRVELYDLRADIGERRDLSKEKPEIADRLLGKLKAWQESVDAKFEGDVVQRHTAQARSTDEQSKQRPNVLFISVEKYPLNGLVLPKVKADDLSDLGSWAKERAHDRSSRHDRLVEFGEWKPAVQAYLASISFADANVGRVLDALKKGPHRDNTIVVFWSDHGYHLGEKGHWHKRTLWERSTHVPFIVVAPGVTEPGSKCSRPVSLLDIYPTLISLCGLDEQEQLEGHDLSLLLHEPRSGWKHVAVTTWQPGNHSVRTDDWRYIRYHTGEEELYDHRADPHEWNNLAAKPEFAQKKLELAQRLPTPQKQNPTAASSPDTRVAALRGPPNRRPNVLLIVSEDNGPELGCYGTPDVRTPRLDQLAAEGCRFANAYVPHAVCSASRAAFLTGLYPFQNGQIGLATHRYAMFRNWDNLPSILKAHGYRTGLMGKLHVNPESAFPFDFRWNEAQANSFGSRNVRRVAEVAGQFFRDTKQPFFLSLNFSDAHFPVLRQQNGLPEKPLSGEDISAPLPFIGADSPRLRQGTADYYNCMMRLDSGVGMVLDELEKAGKADDTLVIYIGDHGAQFSRGKATCYEGGLRIPMILRWPGQVKPGTVRDELVTTIDILPTVIQAASLPARASLPGRSVLPLAAKRDVPWRKYLFAERTAYHSGSFFPQRTLRDDRYKIIVNLTPDEPNPVAHTYEAQGGPFFVYGTNATEIEAAPKRIQQAYATWRNPPPVELYDLRNDPWEFQNLADDADLAPVRQRLLDELQRFRERHGDPLLDARKLQQLAAEHTSVATTLPGGRYGRGQTWKYLTYLQNSDDDMPEASNQESELSFSTVFARGQDGYPDYRIPSLVTTPTGTLLAFAEGRQTLSDHARNDIVVKRSLDHGKTWSPLIHVHQDNDSVLVNPCAVVLESGRVLVMYQRFPYGYHARAMGESIKLLEPGLRGDTVCTTLVNYSDDDGKTWSRPRDVTAGTKRAEKINSTATGPGQGIVLTRGDHKGRIIMPTNEGWWEGRDRFFNVYACYSDDGGETWQYGEPAPNGAKGQGNEVQMVELSDGSVMLNTRNYRGSGFRKTATSKDGGQMWSSLADEDDHPESGCMGSILRYSFGDGTRNRLLFANPNSQRGRQNGTVRVSFDDGKTWPIERVICPQAYAYSCLTKLTDGSIGLVFEANGYRQIKFVRLDLEWLLAGSRGQE